MFRQNLKRRNLKECVETVRSIAIDAKTAQNLKTKGSFGKTKSPISGRRMAGIPTTPIIKTPETTTTTETRIPIIDP
jgi:hypothetical protein